jgi:L-threonylcarbamoyladenylate synthase
VESTIVSLAGGTATLLRAGGIPREAIEAVIGPIAAGPATSARPEAPGQLPGHYAPRTPLRILADGEVPDSGGSRVGYLAFRHGPARPYASVEILSPSGDLREAAAHLFASLHRLDAAGLQGIVAESVPETGLGEAIMDRLRKAAAGSGPAESR